MQPQALNIKLGYESMFVTIHSSLLLKIVSYKEWSFIGFAVGWSLKATATAKWEKQIFEQMKTQ
jgi:hypothetical protein